MLKRMHLSAKILGAIVAVFAVASVISFWITQNRINQQDEEAFRDKLRQITGMADELAEPPAILTSDLGGGGR